MTNPALITVFENGLPPQAKFLYSILSAYTGAGDVAVVPESHVARIMQLSPARLRDYRSILNKSGYCSVALRGENIIFQAVSGHSARENPDVVRDSDRPAPTPTDSGPSTARENPDVVRDSDRFAPTPTDSDPSTARENPDVARENPDVARENPDVARAGGDNRGGRLVGSNLTTLPGKNLLPTNQPVTRPRWETESSEGLLLALGCENLPAIRETVRTVPFEAIRAHALAWQRDTKAQSPGGLLHRIRSGNFAVPEITPADRESSIFLRWRTPAELTAEEERERLAAEENQRWEERRAAANPSPAAPDKEPDTHLAEPMEIDKIRRVEPVEIWKAALTDLAAALPAQTFETWVRDTSVLRYTDGEFVVGVPHAHARDWLHNRLRQRIKITLSRIAQRSVEVTFAVRPREDT